MSTKTVRVHCIPGRWAVVLGVAGLLSSPPAAAAGPDRSSYARQLPGFDALGDAARSAPFQVPTLSRTLVRGDRAMQTDDRLGVPTFVWVAQPGPSVSRTGERKGTASVEAAARRHLSGYASLYRMGDKDVAASVANVHDTGQGAVIVTFTRELNGVEVFRDALKVVMNQNLQLVALSGYLPDSVTVATASAPDWKVDATAAVAQATQDLTGVPVKTASLGLTGATQGPYVFVSLEMSRGGGVGFRQPARVKKVLFHLPEQLVPAWYVELDVAATIDVPDSDRYSYVISALDGQLLFRKDLTEYDSYQYRVWADAASPFIPFDGPQGTAATPHPTGVNDGFQPAFVLPNLVTLQNSPFANNDPWLPSLATELNGNNVEAYADLLAPDGVSAGDLKAVPTAPGVFDRTFDPALDPQVNTTQQQAAITQLFFLNNFLHDWFYDAGFNEATGNAQTYNFGRGGLGADSIRAEAQDYSGRNNANMSTPADGSRPRMQMYVFDANLPSSMTYVDVTAPPAIAGQKGAGTAAFGPQSFTTSGNVLTTTPTNGCAAITALPVGTIAIIDRGTCTFVIKVKNAQIAGAAGVIIANNAAGAAPGLGGTDATITIPTLSVSQADGAAIKAQLALPATVNATLYRPAGVARDGTIDNQVSSHEWGHYLSNRLVANSAGLSTIQSRGMGEGWGDFVALLLAVRPEDTAVASNTTWNGVYGTAGYVEGGPGTTNQSYYFGFRRFPYSTDMTRNALTFKHIQDGQALPVGMPAQLTGGTNAEVHNTGEVWASMLWECYTALLRDTLGASPRLTFAQAQTRMKQYLIASLKATPLAPTFTEARDAVLAAAYANDPVDGNLFCAAFAKRGAGTAAISPARYSTTNVGVTESFACGGALAFVSATLDDSVQTCDSDGYLDKNETGRLTVVLRNVGSTPLSATTATASATNANLLLAGGGAMTFPASVAFGTTTGTANVSMAGAASGIQALDFSVAFTDTGLLTPGPITATYGRRGNLDDVPHQSATDDVESEGLVWTKGGTGAADGSWNRFASTPYAHWWLGGDSGGVSDQNLTSPTLSVSPSGSFSFTFNHRFAFEFDATTTYDGGLLEISSNGGATWTDIGASASPTYGGTLSTCCGNPLGGRSAYVANSAGYPAWVPVTVSLGTAYQGQVVQVRFRTASDLGTGAMGWEIDDIVFTGITNKPFGSLVPQTVCTVSVELIGFDIE